MEYPGTSAGERLDVRSDRPVLVRPDEIDSMAARLAVARQAISEALGAVEECLEEGL